jgi:RND superfamily putative drug exporter
MMENEETGKLARWTAFVCSHAYFVIGVWIVFAIGLNILAPHLESVVLHKSSAFIPDSAPSLVTVREMGDKFDESKSTAIGYLVFENDAGITKSDRNFYERLLPRLREIHEQVDSVQDLLADPATAPLASSKDGKAVYAVVRFHGGMGSATQRSGQEFVTSALRESNPPPGLKLYLTGPAPAIDDELGAEDATVGLITGLTVIIIVILLFVVYRSLATIVVPLAGVGLAFAVSRPIISLLATHAGLDVSVFSVMLLAALILGAGTDYAIFLISSYHEARRRSIDPRGSVVHAASKTSGIIIASGLTVAASCAVMSLTQVVLFRTAGLPCSIGVLIAVLAALTLVPALLYLLGRRGFIQPRPQKTHIIWRRIGVLVVRKAIVVTIMSLVILMLLAMQALRISTGFDERLMQPRSTLSNRGYDAIARHFDPNELTPDYILISSDHDLRNSRDFSALNAVSRAVEKVDGVAVVRSATQPEGKIVPEFTLSYQNGLIAHKLGEASRSLTESEPRLRELEDGMSRLLAGLGQLKAGTGLIANGSRAVENGLNELDQGLASAHGGSGKLSDGSDALAAGAHQLADGFRSVAGPALALLDRIAPPDRPVPTCTPPSTCPVTLPPGSPITDQLRYYLTRLRDGSEQLSSGSKRLSDGLHELEAGLGTALSGSASLADGQTLLTSKLRELEAGTAEAQSGIRQISEGLKQVPAQLQTLGSGLKRATDYLGEVRANVTDSSDMGFYVPKTAFEDARLTKVMDYFISRDGKTARLMILGTSSAYSPDARSRLDAIMSAVREASSSTSLHDSNIEAGGLAAGFRDLDELITEDFVVIALCSLTFIYLILAWLMKELISPLYVIFTIVISYGSALGITHLIWHDIFGIDVYWAVPSISFVALVAVGSDYNMLFLSRIRRESHFGIGSGILRAFAATGGVITTAGVVFAMTMLAMLGSPVHSVAQVGATIGLGLLVDTFIVRTFTVPAIARILGTRKEHRILRGKTLRVPMSRTAPIPWDGLTPVR